MEQKQSVTQTFNDRLRMAADNCPSCPSNNFGRLTWVVEQLQERGIEVSKESVRRWLLDSMPKKRNLEALADIFDVDEQYLLFGNRGVKPQISEQRNDAVMVLLGMMRMAHITVEVPDSNDELAKLRGVNFRARPRSKLQELHVTSATRSEKGTIHVEISHRAHSVPIVAVMVEEDLTVSIFRFEFKAAMESGELDGARVIAEFHEENPRFKKLTSFADL